MIAASRTLVFWSFLLLGCSSPSPGSQTDAMSAEAHRREGLAHARKAQENERQYDPQARSPYDERLRYPQELGGYNPTAAYLRLSREHRSHAREHLEAAHILEQFEEAECGAFPPETRVMCPLLGQVDAVEDVPGGVRVRLAEGVPLHAVVAHMRCHLAFARAHGRTGMPECPLYLSGVRVEPAAGSQRVDLLIADPGDLETLRLRTHRHLEK